MPVNILMPALSPTMEEGRLVEWLVKENDQVQPGDIIAEIETDKALIDLEAADEGRIGKLLVDAGPDAIPVNQVIAVLLLEGEEASDIQAAIETRAPDKPQAEDEQEVSTEVSVMAFDDDQIIADPDLPSGIKMITRQVREALCDAIAEEMRRDENVFVIGEEVGDYQGAYKVTRGLLDEFGARRVVDTPISEHALAGLGVGAAFAGLRPIVEFMTFNFAMQAIDHIINSAAKTHYMSGGKMSCPIVFRGPNGVAAQAAAQHSQDYASWYAHVPGLIVLAPFSAADAKGLLKAAIRNPNPVVFLEHELLYGVRGDVPDWDDYLLPIGQARILREGTDVTLVSYARGLAFCLEAADRLAAEGVSAEIIDLRSLRPLDLPRVIASVQKTNRMVTVEEGWPICSIGSELAACVQRRAFDALDAPILQITGADVPMPYAANLEKRALPNANRIYEAVQKVCYRS